MDKESTSNNYYSQALARALKRLAYKPRSSYEILFDFHKRGFPRDIAERVVKDLQEYGYLDDQAFSRGIISLGQRTNKGWSRIYADLRQRGINRALAEECLQCYYDVEKEGASIKSLVAEYLPAELNEYEKLDMDRTIKRISQRGFSSAAVKRILSGFTWDTYC